MCIPGARQERVSSMRIFLLIPRPGRAGRSVLAPLLSLSLSLSSLSSLSLSLSLSDLTHARALILFILLCGSCFWLGRAWHVQRERRGAFVWCGHIFVVVLWMWKCVCMCMNNEQCAMWMWMWMMSYFCYSIIIYIKSNHNTAYCIVLYGCTVVRYQYTLMYHRITVSRRHILIILPCHILL